VQPRGRLAGIVAMGSAKVRRRVSGSSEKKLPSRGMLLQKKASRNSIGKTRQKRWLLSTPN